MSRVDSYHWVSHAWCLVFGSILSLPVTKTPTNAGRGLKSEALAEGCTCGIVGVWPSIVARSVGDKTVVPVAPILGRASDSIAPLPFLPLFHQACRDSSLQSFFFFFFFFFGALIFALNYSL